MANNPLPVARSTLAIGGATGTFDATAAAADTYIPIGGIRNLGTFGDTYTPINVEEISDARVRKALGTANGGTMEVVCSRRVADVGQIAAKAAAGLGAYNFKLTVPVEGGETQVTYLSALVASKPRGLGGPNDTQTVTFSLEITEAPIEADPS